MSALNFKQFFHIWTQQLLNWLTVKFNSIDIDTSDLAKEVNATANKNEILTKIENTKPDLSTVAKQGSNPNTSLTSVDEKIDGFYNTFDADIASQLQEIIGDSTTGLTGTTQTEEQVSTLRTLQESISDLASAMNTLVDSHIVSSYQYGEFLFDDYMPKNIFDLIMNQNKIIDYTDNVTTTMVSLIFTKVQNTLRFNNLQIITGTPNALIGTHKELYMPNVVSIGCTYMSPQPNLIKVYMPNAFQFYNEQSDTWNSSPNLIDFTIGAKFNSNVNFLSSWTCSNAVRSDLNTLVEPGEPFANNLEKLLHNIREHIAALLPDRTGETAYTITFSAAVKAAIQADQATADAFANKNWTIA